MGLFDFLSPETHNTELKVKVEKLKEPSLPDGFYGIFMKGFPSITSQKSKHSILIELVDVTDEENVTEVYPLLNEQKHPFYNFFYIEHQSENLYRKGWTDWNQIGAFHLNHLQSAYSGIRKLKLSLFILKSAGRDEYLSNLPSIKGEFTEDWSETSFSLELTRPGYTEANKAQIKIQTAAIKLAVSIAYADGSFDNEEGLTIKKWIESILSRKLESQKSDLKKLFNNALENAYKELKSGVFNVDLVCDDIRNIGIKNDKYELLELCLDVMASDGEADKNELKQIYKIANLIGIDYDEIIKMKDKRIILLNPDSYSTDILEEKIGILPGWSNEEINQHIIRQYAKWNGRINTLQEGKQKDNAQAMLDLLAEARKKYS